MPWYLPAHRSSDGKMYLLGPYLTEFDAQRKADELEHPEDPIRYKTSNLSEATRIFKYGETKTDPTLDIATKRVGHTERSLKKNTSDKQWISENYSTGEI